MSESGIAYHVKLSWSEFTILQPVLFHLTHCLISIFFSMNDYIVVNMLAWLYFQIAFCLLGAWGVGRLGDCFGVFA